MKLNLHRTAVLLSSALGLLLLARDIRATTVFAYAPRDMILTFRQAGALNDLEVDIGQVSTYSNAAVGTTNPVSQYTTAQFANAFSSVDSLSWSIAAFVPFNGDGISSSIPNSTLWVTAPRIFGPSKPAAAVVEESAYAQGSVADKMNSIAAEAVFYSGETPTNANANAPGLILIPVGSGFEAGYFLGANGNYGNYFWDNVENTTPATFDTDGLPSRSDLYQLYPDSTKTKPAGTYLGYFELETNGSMVFVRQNAPSTVPPAPVATAAVSVANNVATAAISFATSPGATYTLYYTNSAGLTAPVNTWPSVSTNIIGDGTIQSFQQVSTDTDRYYIIGAH